MKRRCGSQKSYRSFSLCLCARNSIVYHQHVEFLALCLCLHSSASLRTCIHRWFHGRIGSKSNRCDTCTILTSTTDRRVIHVLSHADDLSLAARAFLSLVRLVFVALNLLITCLLQACSYSQSFSQKNKSVLALLVTFTCEYTVLTIKKLEQS